MSRTDKAIMLLQLNFPSVQTLPTLPPSAHPHRPRPKPPYSQLSHKPNPNPISYPVILALYAAFHWALKLVFTSFPVGNIVLLKSEGSRISKWETWSSESMHPDFRLGKTSWEIEFPRPMESSITLFNE